MPKIIRTDAIFDDNSVVSCYPLPDDTPPPTEGTPDFTIKVGHVLHVEAPSSMLPGSTENMDLFAWTFGDTTTGSVFNATKGFNAAHLYDTAGSYTVTLVRTPLGLTASPGTNVAKTWTVLVTNESQQSIYVSNSTGNDSNSGTIGSPVKSIGRALAMAGPWDRIYLKRGDTWRNPNDGTTSLAWTVTVEGLEIRDYGTGTLPVIESPVQQYLSTFVVNAENVVFRNIYFRHLDNGYARSGTRVFTPNRKNFAAVGCYTERVGYFVQGDKNPPVDDNDPVTDGVLLLNCVDSEGEYCSRNQWVFGSYSRWCIYGCKAYDSIYEATIRFYGHGYRLVAVNGGEFGNRDNSTTRYGENGITSNANNIGKGALIFQKGSYVWIDSVTIKSDAVLYSDAGIYLGPLGKEHGNLVDPTALTDHVVVRNCVDRSYERNRDDDSQPVQIICYAGLHRASIVGNTDFQRIYVNGTDASVNRGIENLFIRGNTMRNEIVNYSPEETTYG